MSQPVDSTPPKTAAEAPEPPLAPGPSPELAALEAPPPLSGAPYRLPEPPDGAELAVLRRPFAVPSRPRPLLGPALSVFAVLLWSFVVAGQFTTSWMGGGPLPPGIAAGVVLATTFAAWIGSLRRSRAAAPPLSTRRFVGRAAGIAALAFLLFLVSIFGATVAGSAGSRNHDFLIALVLVFLATVAAIVGRSSTWPTAPDRTHSQRVRSVFLWMAGVLTTVIAGAELLVNG